MTGKGESRPDDLWVVQINPREREGAPTSLDEIADRRNELAGNISLNQELHFFERVNDWIDADYVPEERFSLTKIQFIPLGRTSHCSTKLNRSDAFIEELIDLGERRAAEFLQH